MSKAQTNRSMLRTSVIPELAYPDVRAAATWLCEAFGFVERLRIGDHRVQLTFGEDGALVVRDGAPPVEPAGVSVMVRVASADRHAERSARAGARIVVPPTDYPYGERQYTAVDLAGYAWTFSETIADVDPASWGGELVAE